MRFQKEFECRTAAAEEAVRRYLPQSREYPGSLDEAVKYSVLAGGKRLRPVMLGYTCEAYGGSPEDAAPFMASMEYIHTSSLIHDDLPAIDNDELRRAKPTVHKAFGEAVGILAGDALLNYAYEVLMNGILACSDIHKGAMAARSIASKSGLYGMLGGQGLDVETEKGRISMQDTAALDLIYKMKTSALIEASLMAGAVLAGAPREDVQILEKIGTDIGMAFQIKDDILDLTGTDESLGKPAHSDEKNQKETYISLLGQEAAEEKVRELTGSALDLCETLQCDVFFLQGLIAYLMDRTF